MRNGKLLRRVKTMVGTVQKAELGIMINLITIVNTGHGLVVGGNRGILIHSLQLCY